MPERALSFGQIIPWLALKKGGEDKKGRWPGKGGRVSSILMHPWQTQKLACAQSHQKWGKHGLHPSAAFFSFTEGRTFKNLGKSIESIKWNYVKTRGSEVPGQDFIDDLITFQLMSPPTLFLCKTSVKIQAGLDSFTARPSPHWRKWECCFSTFWTFQNVMCGLSKQWFIKPVSVQIPWLDKSAAPQAPISLLSVRGKRGRESVPRYTSHLPNNTAVHQTLPEYLFN